MTHFAKPMNPPKIHNVSRRFVLRGLAASGALVLSTTIRSRQSFAANAVGWATGAGDMPNGLVTSPHVFVFIAPSGIATILTHRSEMGTGVRTSVPLIV